MKRFFAIIALLFYLATLVQAAKFLPDDPIQEDPDQLPVAAPTETQPSELADLLENTFSDPAEGAMKCAQNVNTVGDVPDSSWFENRVGKRRLTLAELREGPAGSDGPDTREPWFVIQAKSQGVTPGFTIKDSRDVTYFVKFDPVDYPELMTSAELISTKFFHAFGYNVPENFLVHIAPEKIQLSPDAVSEDNAPISEKLLKEILQRAPLRPDGTIRVIASKKLPGKSLGPFLYHGIREDDPNDLFPHENRRELRGLRVFASWLNHFDTRSANTMDAFLSLGKRKGFVKHFLLDFGSTLGSAGEGPQMPRHGNEYVIDFEAMMKSIMTFGIWQRPWADGEYPSFPAIGRFESKHFDPAEWKPGYPNPAFERMQSDDAFWAARIVFHFTDEMIAEVVASASISDPAAARYLIDTLIRRRDKVVAYYFSLLNPLSDFSVRAKDLTFRNLGLESGLATAVTYEWQWYGFDNENRLRPLTELRTGSNSVIALPSVRDSFYMIRLRTKHADFPSWSKKVEIYIRNDGKRKVVGVERET